MKFLPRFSSIASLLFFVSFLSFSYFYQGGGHNEAARFDTIRAVLEYGRLDIGPFIYNSADVIFVNGAAYSGKAPGTFYLGLPSFAITLKTLAWLGVGEHLRYHVACYVATSLSISLLGAALVVLLYQLGLRYRFEPRDSTMAALMLGFGTMIFPFSTLFFSHVASAFFLLLGYYQIFVYLEHIANGELPNRKRWHLWVAGASLGFSAVLEYPAALGAGLIGLYFLARRFRAGIRALVPDLTILISAGLIGIAPLLIYNVLAFQKPFYLTYEAYAQADSQDFVAHKKGLLGIRIPLLDPSAWPQFLMNLEQITIRPLRGLFFLNPVLLPIFLGFVLALRRVSRLRLDALLGLMILVSYLTLNAGFGDSITYWGGGASFGPRYLITALPFLFLPLLFVLRLEWFRPVFYALFGLSVFLCLMATAIEPRTPYTPSNPVFFYYLPRFISGLFSLNPSGVFSNEPILQTTVAFNWGRLLDLPLGAELYPLYLLWIWAAWRLDRLLALKKSYFLVGVGLFCGLAAWLSTASMAT